MTLKTKVTVPVEKQLTVKRPTYPYLAEGMMTGVIVLFTSPGSGVVLQEGSVDNVYMRLGALKLNLSEGNFRPFYGTVALTQEKEYV